MEIKKFIIFLSVCLFYYFVFGQTNEKMIVDSQIISYKKQQSALIGKWNLLNLDLEIDTSTKAYSITFDSTNFIKSSKYANIPTFSMINDSLFEVFCDGYLLPYRIDSIRRSNEYWVSVFDKNNYLCSRMFIVLEYPLMYSTVLKSLKGIQNHFTDTEVYLIDGWDKPISPIKNPPIIFHLPENFDHQYIFINYGEYECNKSFSTDRLIQINKKGIVKTDILANPKDLFLKNYKVFDYNKSIINLLLGSEFYKLKEMSIKDRILALKKYKIDHNQKVVIIHRFNPSRKRVVNPAFGETITGQVQDLEIVNSNIFY